MIIFSQRFHEEVAKILSVLRESIIRQHFHPGHDSSGVYSLRYGQHTVCGGVELVSSLTQQPAWEGATKQDEDSVLTEAACVNPEPVSIRQHEWVLSKRSEVEDQTIILVRRSCKGTQGLTLVPLGIHMEVILICNTNKIYECNLYLFLLWSIFLRCCELSGLLARSRWCFQLRPGPSPESPPRSPAHQNISE